MPENRDDIDLEGWDLHHAAKENTVDIVQALIARGDDVDARAEDGWTPLHDAAWKNFLDVARLLIEHGAEVDARTENGRTPLHWAAVKNSLNVARLLLDGGADVGCEGQRRRYTPAPGSLEQLPRRGTTAGRP
jgi:ankyrin repeat protein